MGDVNFGGRKNPSIAKKTRRAAYRQSAKAAKRGQAEERRKERAQRTAEQQIALLDMKFGKDCGAKKERARLNAQIEVRGKKTKS